mgnify:CR=1 FL=1
MKKYEGNMKKVGNMKNHIMENKNSPYIRAVGLGKIPSSSPYLWARRVRGFAISRFRVLQRKDMKEIRRTIREYEEVCSPFLLSRVIHEISRRPDFSVGGWGAIR